MKIEKYISELLFRYQCVSVPAFGAFLCEWHSVSLTEGNAVFMPPRKVISFNSNIKTNDGLLANHVALQEKISYENALVKINTQVVFWLEKLQNKEVLVLENIGEIIFNSENNFAFIPNTSVNYLTDSFGLSSFTSPEITRETQTNTESDTILLPVEKNEILVENSLEKETSVLPLVTNKPNVNWLKYAAAAIVFTSVATYGYKMYFDYSVNQKTDVVEKTVQKKINQKIQEATFALPNAEEVVNLSSVEKTEAKYHVIAGAFKNESNAKKAMKQLISKGSNAQLLTKYKNGLTLVTFGSFCNLNEAENLKQNIKTKESIETWLLIF